MAGTSTIPIIRIKAGKIEEVKDTLVVERDVSITFNEESVLLTTCSPSNTHELVYGRLFSEGIIASVDEVTLLNPSENDSRIEAKTTKKADPDAKRPIAPVESSLTLPVERLLEAARECRERGVTFRKTGGTHAAAIGDGSKLLNFFEDVSRTCALEKAVGDALMRRIRLDDKFIFLSSRLSKVMVEKIARCGIPIVGAVSAPSLQAVKEAKKLGICVCGFVRDDRLNIYSHKWRMRL